MKVVLLVGLGMLLGILLLLVAVWLFLRRFLRKASAALGQISASQIPPPFRVHLTPVTEGKWLRDPAVTSRAAELRELGFVEAGAYAMEELFLQHCLAFVHPGTSTMAAVYHLTAGVGTDLVCENRDGTSFTVGDRAEGENLPRRPTALARRFPGLATRELYERFLAERPTDELVPVTPADFVARFEKSYADQMDWLSERGGYSVEELRVSGEKAKDASDEVLANLRHQFANGCLKNWWRLQPNPPLALEPIEERLVVIHDDLTPTLVVELFNGAVPETETKEAQVQDLATGTTPRLMFAALNEARGNPLRKVWEKVTPLAADFYLAPEPPADEEGEDKAKDSV